MDKEYFVSITENNVKFLCVVYFWIEFTITTILILRQMYHVKNREWGPRELLQYPEYTEGIYHLSAILLYDSLWQDVKIKFFTTTIWAVTIASNVIPFLWDSFQLADSEFDFMPNFLSLEIRQDISFGFWFALFELLVLDFPVKFFQKQLLQSHGFHNKSMLNVVRNQISETVVTTMNRTLASFCLSFFINIYDEHTSEHHTMIRYSILAVFYLVAYSIFDMFILCLSFFDKKYISIPPGSLRDRVEILCDKFGYNLDHVYIEVVPPETPMNAYCYSFFGLHTRIVLVSSIIEGFYDLPNSKQKSPGLTVTELEGIFGHEIGHWVKSHNEQRFAFLNIFSDPLAFVSSVWLKDKKFLFEAFCFSPKDTKTAPYPLLPGLFIAQQVILRPWSEICYALWNPWCSANEAEADAFTAPIGLGEELKRGLVRMEVLLTGFPTSDPAYSFFYNHHPTLVERLRGIDNASQ